MSLPTRENQQTGDFEYVPVSRQKAEEIASEKIFGWQPLSAETVEKIRTPARAVAAEFGSRALGGVSDLIKFIAETAQLPKKFTEKFPSSEAFKGHLEKLTGEPFEKELGTIGNYVKDVAGRAGDLASLGGATSRIAAVGIPVAGATVKHALKAVGAPEWAQTGATMLTDLSLGFKGTQNPREVARTFHREANNLIPPNAVMDGRALRTELDDIVTTLQRGGTSPSKTPVITKAKEIIDTIDQNGGMLPVNEAYAYRTAINDIAGDPATLEGAKRLFNPMRQRMNQFMQVYGDTQNPQFIKTLREGDDIVQGLANSEKATKFLRSKAPKDLKHPLSYVAFALNPKTYATFFGAAKMAELGHQIANSPALRRYYFRTIRDALSGNSKQAVSNLKAFDREATRELPELEEGDFEYIPSNQSSQ